MTSRKVNAIRRLDSGVCEVDLSSGHVALFDACDLEKVSLFRWFASTTTGSRTWYARGRLEDMTSRNSPWHMHRVVLCFPLLPVDHINGDGLDNRRCNLRFCTHRQNCCNIASRTFKKTSVYRGVYRLDSGRWNAQIRFHGQLINLGTYEEERIAAAAYDTAAKFLNGSFAQLNLSFACVGSDFVSRIHSRIEKSLNYACS